MASVHRLLSRSCGAKLQAVDSTQTLPQRSGLTSLSYNAGSSWTTLQYAVEMREQRGAPRPEKAAIRAGSSKQKKKPKEKKRSSAKDKQWKFDELMLVWDDVFEKACDNTAVASALYELSRNGFSKYGHGCVLINDIILTRPWGAASGFTFKSRYSSSDSPQLPLYTSTQWTAEYVPKEFILDPSKAPDTSDTSDASSTGDDAVQLVDRYKLRSVLGGMDKTRLVGLLADSTEDLSGTARDAGGEAPYDPAKDELVIMLSLLVDGQVTVGADVLSAFPTVEAEANGNAAGLWTLKLRDDLPS